jgi:dTDP-4-amino-4,6-dideoxygalactose transaminase
VSRLGPYKITIIDLRAQRGKIRDQVRMAIDEVTDSQQCILGPVVKRFEQRWRSAFNAALRSITKTATFRTRNLLRARHWYCLFIPS